jgi:hypothetical protein
METKDLKKLKKAAAEKEASAKKEKTANEAVPLDDAALEKAAGGGLFDDIPRVETHDYDEEVKKNA